MSKIRQLACVLALTGFPMSMLASEPREVTWEMLAPPAATIENPFERLTPEQTDKLRQILRFEMREDAGQDSELLAETQRLRAELAADKLDVDGLFEARREIIQTRETEAARVNTDIVGTHIRMPGYVLPLAFAGLKVTEFLLVPTVGACIHTPPPPANQIVHVVYPEGIEVGGLFTPVWISGVMSARNSVQEVGFSDGFAAIPVGYTMSPDEVTHYEE